MKKIIISVLTCLLMKNVTCDILNWNDFLQNLPCASAFFDKNNTTKLVHAKKASFASGKILESLDLIALTSCNKNAKNNLCQIRATKTIKDFQNCIEKNRHNRSHCIADFPYLPNESHTRDKVPFLSSLGSHDACTEIPNYQYCSVMVGNQPFWSYGICIPNVCSTDEIISSFEQILQNEGKLESTVHKNSLFTSTCGDFSYSWTYGTTIMVTLCFLILLLIIVGTIMDYKQQNSEKTILKSFSLITNIHSLLAPMRHETFDIFDGIRTFSILWVIFGHTFVFKMMGLGFTNMIDLVGINDRGWDATYPAQAVTAGYFAVDSFFFMSAFLAMFFVMKRVEKLKRENQLYSFVFQIPLLFLLRFLRLTPTYSFILFMYMKVFTQMESGPFWNLLDTDINFCKKYWYTNLLYINNVYPTNGTSCYPVTWYLANDFQFFLLVPFFAFLSVCCLKKISHIISIVFLLLGCLISIIFAFIESYRNNWSINIYDENFLDGYFQNYYTKPWFRCPPYLLGMILAIVWFYYFDLDTSPYKIIPNDIEEPLLGSQPKIKYRDWIKNTKIVKYGLLAISFTLLGITVLGGKGAYANVPSHWTDTEMSMYIAFSKFAWTIGLCILCLLLFLGEIPIISHILCNHLMAVLGRLTYCVYLIHPSILYWMYFSENTPTHYSDIWFTLSFLGVVFASFLISILIHIGVEKPIDNIIKLFLKKY